MVSWLETHQEIPFVDNLGASWRGAEYGAAGGGGVVWGGSFVVFNVVGAGVGVGVDVYCWCLWGVEGFNGAFRGGVVYILKLPMSGQYKLRIRNLIFWLNVPFVFKSFVFLTLTGSLFYK